MSLADVINQITALDTEIDAYAHVHQYQITKVKAAYIAGLSEPTKANYVDQQKAVDADPIVQKLRAIVDPLQKQLSTLCEQAITLTSAS